MNKTLTDLLPCPFCGGPVELESAPSTRSEVYGKRDWWGVVCRNTINLGGTCAIYQIPSASKEAAIERWNRRAHLGHPEPRAEVMDEQPSLTNPLTPYGMLVRALRIVTGTLLYDMAKSMSLSPATLSAMEVGRRPVTYADACGAADFFASRGISGTLSALEHAIDAALAGEGQ